MIDPVKYINDVKNEIYFNIKAQLISQVLTFFRKREFIMIDINDYQIENARDIDQITAITRDSIVKIREFISGLTPPTDFRKIQLEIFAKRFNINTIVIRFDPLNFNVYIINNVNDMSMIEKFQNNGFANVGIVLSYLYHQAALPEIYRFYRDFDTMTRFDNKLALFENWYLEDIDAGHSVGKSKNSSDRRRGTESPSYYNAALLNKFRDKCLMIGTFALHTYLPKATIHHSSLEMIYPDDVYQLIRDLPSGFRYRVQYSDSDFFGRHLLITAADRPVCTIYEGKYFCFPYRELNGYKLGTYPIIMKYLALKSLFKPKLKENMALFRDSEYRNTQLYGDPHCLGINLSSYKRYYIANWGNKPWSYSRKVFTGPAAGDSEQNKSAETI